MTESSSLAGRTQINLWMENFLMGRYGIISVITFNDELHLFFLSAYNLIQKNATDYSDSGMIAAWPFMEIGTDCEFIFRTHAKSLKDTYEWNVVHCSANYHSFTQSLVWQQSQWGANHLFFNTQTLWNTNLKQKFNLLCIIENDPLKALIKKTRRCPLM